MDTETEQADLACERYGSRIERGWLRLTLSLSALEIPIAPQNLME